MNKPYINTHWILFLLILLLVGVAASVGLISETIYSNNAHDLIVKFKFYDLSLLALVLPVSLIALILTILNNQRAQLFTLGLTAYFIFSYCVTIFLSRQNDLFLIYIFIITLSIFYFLNVFTDIYSTFTGNIKKRLSKFVVISLLFSGISGMLFWLSEAVNILLNPNSEMFVNAPQVIDMAIFLPLTIYGAIRLLKNRPNGIWISSIMMVFFVFIGISVIMMEVGLLMKTNTGMDIGKVYSFTFISALNIIITVLTYRNISMKIKISEKITKI